MTEVTTDETDPKPRPRRTQRERRALSERRIVHATLRTIAQQGVSRASLAEIGELAGYSRGLPAHLFGNKDKLLAECLRRLMVDYWIEDMPKISGEGAFAALGAAIRKWVHDLSAHNELSRAHLALVQEAHLSDAEATYPELVPLIRHYVSGSEQRFRNYIVAGQASGEIDPSLDADFESLLIHTTLRGISTRWIVDPSSVDVHNFARMYVDRLAQQMLVAPGDAPAKPARAAR